MLCLGPNTVVEPVIQSEVKLNKSTVTITTDLHEDMNKSSGSVTQVTVVTTHPPVLLPPIDSSTPQRFPSRMPESDNEVVIVSNETNKTLINESSTDDDPYPSLDSLEIGTGVMPINIVTDKPVRLDESEVLIVSPTSQVGLDESDRVNDTSHVSVVTVGDDLEHVRDSSSHEDGKSDSG